MDFRDKILSFVQTRGPVLPGQIAKHLQMDMIMASAHLSELVAHKKLTISNLKVGGSPLYFLKGQEAKLEQYASNLDEKEQRALNELKEHKVLEDRSLAPLTRVALREIKDFAVPLKVTHNENVYLFWKWHLLSNNDASPFIESFFGNTKQPKTNNQPSSESVQQQVHQEKNVTDHTPKAASEAVPQSQETNGIVSNQEENNNQVQQQVEQHQKESIQEKPLEKETQQNNIQKKTEQQHQAQQTFTQTQNLPDDAFLKKIHTFLSKKSIHVKRYDIIKKNSEIDLELSIPTNLGEISYFCKAKNKKKISEADVGSAFMAAALKRLPVILLSPGELTKKTQELLAEELKGVTFFQVKL